MCVPCIAVVGLHSHFLTKMSFHDRFNDALKAMLGGEWPRRIDRADSRWDAAFLSLGPQQRCDDCGNKCTNKCAACNVTVCVSRCASRHRCIADEEVLADVRAGHMRIAGIGSALQALYQTAAQSGHTAAEWLPTLLKAWRHAPRARPTTIVRAADVYNGACVDDATRAVDATACRALAAGLMVAGVPRAHVAVESQVQGAAAVFGAAQTHMEPGKCATLMAVPTQAYAVTREPVVDFEGPTSHWEAFLITLDDASPSPLDGAHAAVAALPTDAADPRGVASRAGLAAWTAARTPNLMHQMVLVSCGRRAFLVQAYYPLYSAADWLDFAAPLPTVERRPDVCVVRNAAFRGWLDGAVVVNLCGRLQSLVRMSPTRLRSTAGLTVYGHITGVRIEPPPREVAAAMCKLSLSVSRCQFSPTALRALLAVPA